MDVLEGINPNDWHKIKQAAIEVHDLDDRLENIKNILQSNNFQTIIIEQEEIFKSADCEIYTIYATKGILS